MNTAPRRPLIVGVVVVLIVLLVGGYYGMRAYANHQRAQVRDSLSKGYATQPLTAPFVLKTKWWLPDLTAFATSGRWNYVYSVNLPQAETLAAAKSQLSRGAYQVDANHPDVITDRSATLYRDLITEDVALKVIIGPTDTSGPSQAAKAPTGVSVVLTPLAGQ